MALQYISTGDCKHGKRWITRKEKIPVIIEEIFLVIV